MLPEITKETQNYLHIFYDAIYSNLFFTLSDESLLWVSLHFNYNKWLITITSILGVIIASIINYYIGLLIAKYGMKFIKDPEKLERYKTLKVNTNKFSLILLLFTPIHLYGNMITLLHGIANILLWRTLLAIAVIRAIYYSAYIVFANI